jgi:hypothetical protein
MGNWRTARRERPAITIARIWCRASSDEKAISVSGYGSGRLGPPGRGWQRDLIVGREKAQGVAGPHRSCARPTRGTADLCSQRSSCSCCQAPGVESPGPVLRALGAKVAVHWMVEQEKVQGVTGQRCPPATRPADAIGEYKKPGLKRFYRSRKA